MYEWCLHEPVKIDNPQKMALTKKEGIPVVSLK